MSLVKCEICGLEMRLLPQSHLIKHGLTTSEYKEIYHIESFFSDDLRKEYSIKLKGVGVPNCRHASWNKGKKGLPDQKKGKTWDEFYGKEKSRNIKVKLSKSKIGKKMNITEKDRERRRESARKMNAMDRKAIGPAISKSLTGLLSGNKNPNWRGGASFEPYAEEFNQELKEKIRDLWGRKCALCGEPENGQRLCIHHINYNKRDNQIENLVPLHRDCHNKTNNSKRFFFKGFFVEKLKEQFNIAGKGLCWCEGEILCTIPEL